MPIISRRRSVGTSGPGVPVATHLAFTTPPGLSGVSPYTLSPQPVVAAQNGSNTTDTTYAGTVTITLNVLTGSPVLSGTTTKALVLGVADFSGNALVVTGAGTWQLQASLAGLASATSSTGTTTAGGATTIATDNFTGTGLSALNGRTTTTGSKTWTDVFSGMRISTGGTTVEGSSGPTGAGDYGATIDAGTADATVQATVTAITSAPGLLARWTDTSNYVLLIWNGGTFTLISRAGGVNTTWNTAGTLSVGDTIYLKVNGTTITYGKNGGAAIDTRTITAPSSNNHGIYVNAAVLDDFSCVTP